MRFRSVAVVAVLLWAPGGVSAHHDDVAVADPWSIPDVGTQLDPERAGRLLDRHPFEVGPVNVLPDRGPDPSAPWGLVVYPVPEGVRLDWMAPLQGTPDLYNVYRSVDGGPSELVATTQQTAYTDLQEGWDQVHTLVYHVTASYGANESSPSNSAAFLAGPLGCMAVHVYPDLEGNRTPPLDYGVNEHYVDCVMHNADLRG